MNDENDGNEGNDVNDVNHVIHAGSLASVECSGLAQQSPHPCKQEGEVSDAHEYPNKVSEAMPKP